MCENSELWIEDWNIKTETEEKQLTFLIRRQVFGEKQGRSYISNSGCSERWSVILLAAKKVTFTSPYLATSQLMLFEFTDWRLGNRLTHQRSVLNKAMLQNANKTYQCGEDKAC